MLARKRGALRDKGRKMKKNAPTALQTDVLTNEDWEKVMQRDGLILVDVYSNWSGPCTGMISILKKIKMEVGGDSLSYATARCDDIEALARFRGKSEPVWMFIRNGKMINFMFGANSPKLQEMLFKELKRLKTNQPPEFSLLVSDLSPKEAERIKAYEEAHMSEIAEKQALEEMKLKRKYEAELEHYVDCLRFETCIVLFPWIFKDEEGNQMDLSSSTTYVDLKQLLPQQFKIEKDIPITLDEEHLAILQKESEYEFSPETIKLMLDDETRVMHLKMADKLSDMDVDNLLIDLLFGEPIVPLTPNELVDGCFVDRNLPPLPDFPNDGSSIASGSDKLLLLTTVWVPLNPRNRASAVHLFFKDYVETTYTFKDPDIEIPTTIFKFTSSKSEELKKVMEKYKSEIINFGIFENDEVSNPKLISLSIDIFEKDVENKTGKEAFICVIKKLDNEAFLSFAGLGPYYVSESVESAKEEAPLYFPEIEEDILDDEDTQAEENAAT